MLKNEEGNLKTWLKLESMKLDFIKRDIEELGLDESSKISIMTADEIEETLGEEFPDYNADITFNASDADTIIVISGYSSKENNEVRLYYYEYRESLIRQLRKYNQKGDLEEIKRSMNNEEKSYSELEDGRIHYIYNEDGLKKYAKIEDPFIGYIYLIYDEAGKVEFKILDQSVEQTIKKGDKEYRIIDGYFKPTNNGYICLPPKSLNELKPEDIQRTVFGDISEEDKKVIIADLTEERKAEVIRAMNLVFELEWITQEKKLDELETILEEPTPEEVVEQTVRDIIEDLRKSGIPYTLEQFIKDTKNSPSGVIRPQLTCKDGYTISVQANRCLYCMPEAECLEKYEEYEVRGETEKNIKEFERWTSNSEDEQPLYGYVPEEEIIKLINKHNGLDKKIMRQRVEQWKQLFESQDTEIERTIKEATGGNVFLETIMRYAARHIILQERNASAKKLLDDYEKIDNSKLVDDEDY